MTTIVTHQPGPATLAAMGRTAHAAADTWTLRHWAGVLASRAGPKDYRGQLEQLYGGIIDRWRYVMEPGEWIHGTPRSLLGVVLGLDYNGVADPTRARVEQTSKVAKGWGDCDDVSTLAAAGVLALGMQPFWRVSRAPSGEAHVSVAALTPKRELVQIDPVGHPDHPFGWAQSGPGVSVQYHALDGMPVDAPGFGGLTMAHRFNVPAPLAPAPNYFPQHMLSAPPVHWFAVPYGMGAVPADQGGTYLGVLARAPRGGLMPYQGRVRRHLVCVAPTDTRGPRVLAVPGMHARVMMGGSVMDGTPAVDQFGDEYTYVQPADVWMPRAATASRVATYGFGATKAERRARRKARRRRTVKKIGRFFKRVGQGVRKVFSKIMGSKFVQTIVAGALQVFGVPMMLTKKLLSVASKFVGSGGLIKLLKGIRKNPKKVLKTLAKTVAAAGRSDLLKSVPGFGAIGSAEPVLYELEQRGVPFYAAPVEGIVGLDGVFGDAGEGGPTISDRPTPGYYYRVKKGDSPDAIAREAYGKAHPGGRWISSSPANAYATRASKSDYEKKYYGSRIVSLLAKYSGDIPGGAGDQFPVLWIPPAEGVEPIQPVIPPSPPDVGPEDEAYEDEDEGMPPLGPVPVPPSPPDVEPDELVPEDTAPPAPYIPPIIPSGPVRPEPEPIPVEPDYPPAPGPGPMPPLGPVVPPQPEGGGLKPIPWPEPPIQPKVPDAPPAPSPAPGPGGAARDDMAPFVPLALIASLLL